MSLLLLRSLPAGAFRARYSPSSPLPLIFAFRLIKSNPIASLQRRAISSISASAASASASASEIVSISAHKHPFPPSSDENSAALEWVNRTAFCGELSEPDVGKRVRLCGWVALHRVHGALTFVTLRDHTGTVQVTTLPDEFPEAHSVMNGLRLEYVIAVEGFVRPRPMESINKNMKTGSIEVAVEHVHVLNAVRFKLPFLVTTAEETKDSIKEEIRLRYRCLDLRRPHMNSNIVLRHRVVKLIRRYLEDFHGFMEVD